MMKLYPAPPMAMLCKFFPWKGGLSLHEFRHTGLSRNAITMIHPPVYPFEFEETFVCQENVNDQISHNF